MEKFQKKIGQMRQAINSIKLDIETMKSVNSIREIAKSKSTAMIMPLTTKFFNPPVNKIKKKSVFTHFKDNCPLKKENFAKAANNTSVAIKSNATNYSQIKQYNFQYPLNKTNKDSKLSDYTNANHYIKQQTSVVHPSNKSKARNKLINLSPETKRISTNQSTISSQRRQQYHNRHNNKHNQNQRIENNDSFRKNKKENDADNDGDEFKSIADPQIINHKRYSSNNPSYNNNEEIITELVDFTNAFHLKSNGPRVTTNSFSIYYKAMLKQMKFKDEFINKLFLMYKHNNNHSNKRKNCNRDETLVAVYKWIQSLSQPKQSNNVEANNKGNYYYERKKENSLPRDDYQLLCERIMKKYKIKDIREFNMFLSHLIKKANVNDNFLEAMKNILIIEKRFENNN